MSESQDLIPTGHRLMGFESSVDAQWAEKVRRARVFQLQQRADQLAEEAQRDVEEFCKGRRVRFFRIK